VSLCNMRVIVVVRRQWRPQLLMYGCVPACDCAIRSRGRSDRASFTLQEVAGL